LLGLESSDTLREDLLFLQNFYGWMTESQANWSQTFFDWFCGKESEKRAANSPQSHLYSEASFEPVRAILMSRTPLRPERLKAPYFQRQTPAHLEIDLVERLWTPIAERDDWGPFQQHLDLIDQARLAYDWSGR
jgi:serine/tyrosine/threonine adenylyltransferase